VIVNIFVGLFNVVRNIFFLNQLIFCAEDR